MDVTNTLKETVEDLRSNQLPSLREHFVEKVHLVELCQLEHDQQKETAALHETRGQKLLKVLNEVLDQVSSASHPTDRSESEGRQ